MKIEELHEYKGVLHCHTAYSDSSGRMPYVIKCAKNAGLDYVVIADHNTLKARRQGWEGWHHSTRPSHTELAEKRNAVLLVIGVEVTSVKGHALAINLYLCLRWRRTHPNTYLPEIKRLGGTALIAHPEQTSRATFLRKRHADWPDLTTDAYIGIEIWSYMHDWIEWAYPWHMIAAIRNPDAAITGPHSEVLSAWDTVALRRHVSGVGALDSHEFRIPINHFRWSLLKVLPMAYLFRTIRTHVLAPEWTGDAPKDIATLTTAFTTGRCFTAYDLAADSTGTRFTARRGRETAIMGDEITAGGELEFVATLPQPSHITLLRNSEPVAKSNSHELHHRDTRPGVYRVEAHLNTRPWVFTNHIYVR